ncbi:MAG TPA: GDSL-type esterase/lipase family protein [Gammaproteobacteria bacterium]|nr:GDSL-type esterase/lipase family protein [Gammaproteobacteria bacterium]
MTRTAWWTAQATVLLLMLTPGSDGRAASEDTVSPAPAGATTPFRNPYAAERLQLPTLAARQTDGVELVFLGDSITQSWDRQGRAVWKEFYGQRHALNFGVNMAQTGNLLWRIEAGHFDAIRPRLVVLMIGTNNTRYGGHSPPQIAAGVAAVIEALQSRLPETRILLLGIFPRGRTTDDPWRRNNEAANRLLASQGDGKRVIFRDIGSAFLNRDGSVKPELMKDPVHLNARGYRVWAEAIEADISRLLDEAETVPAAAVR